VVVEYSDPKRPQVGIIGSDWRPTELILHVVELLLADEPNALKVPLLLFERRAVEADHLNRDAAAEQKPAAERQVLVWSDVE
jgi:hypothetical protein